MNVLMVEDDILPVVFYAAPARVDVRTVDARVTRVLVHVHAVGVDLLPEPVVR